MMEKVKNIDVQKQVILNNMLHNVDLTGRMLANLAHRLRLLKNNPSIIENAVRLAEDKYTNDRIILQKSGKQIKSTSNTIHGIKDFVEKSGINNVISLSGFSVSPQTLNAMATGAGGVVVKKINKRFTENRMSFPMIDEMLRKQEEANVTNIDKYNDLGNEYNAMKVEEEGLDAAMGWNINTILIWSGVIIFVTFGIPQIIKVIENSRRKKRTA